MNLSVDREMTVFIAVKSRVLMALSREEPEDWCDEYRPLVPWDHKQSCPSDTYTPESSGPAQPGVDDVMPTVSKATVEEEAGQSMAVVTVAVGADSNDTAENVEDFQAMMHPDIAVSPTLGHMANFSADLETA